MKYKSEEQRYLAHFSLLYHTEFIPLPEYEGLPFGPSQKLIFLTFQLLS